MDENKFNAKKWEDLFLLISLGHYHVSKAELKDKLKVYSKMTDRHVSDISSFSKKYGDKIYYRLHKRISYMKPEAYHKLCGSSSRDEWQ